MITLYHMVPTQETYSIYTGALQMAFYCFVCVSTVDLRITRKGTGA